MKKIQFGLCLPLESSMRSRRATWLADMDQMLNLAQGHFDSAWMVDHLQFGDTDVLEGFSTLAFMAARHPDLHFGNAVLCQSFRNPALVAKMAATIQFLSQGRFILGMGAGWHKEEYRAYGYDFPPNPIRVAQLDEAVQIIRLLWLQGQATFEGRYYRVFEAHCEPRPDPLPVLMIGAFKPRMLRLTAQHADWWNVSSTGPARYRLMAAEFERACAETNRDPSTVRRTWIGGCACAPTLKEAEALTGGRWSADEMNEDFGFCGTPEQVASQLQRFIELGVDYFMLDCSGFPSLTTLDLLIGKVLPLINNP